MRNTGFTIRQGGLESPGPLRLTCINGGHLNLVRAECLRSFYRVLNKYAKVNFTKLLYIETISLLSHKYSSTFWIIKQIPLGDILAHGVKFSIPLSNFSFMSALRKA